MSEVIGNGIIQGGGGVIPDGFSQVLVVSGTLVPDATGTYSWYGYNGPYPTWLRSDSKYRVQLTDNGTAWDTRVVRNGSNQAWQASLFKPITLPTTLANHVNGTTGTVTLSVGP